MWVAGAPSYVEFRMPTYNMLQMGRPLIAEGCLPPPPRPAPTAVNAQYFGLFYLWYSWFARKDSPSCRGSQEFLESRGLQSAKMDAKRRLAEKQTPPIPLSPRCQPQSFEFPCPTLNFSQNFLLPNVISIYLFPSVSPIRHY